MSDAAGFLQAIRAQPGEDTPRLVFADWLDEHGGEADRARAEFIRVQVEATALARLPHPDMAAPAEVDDLARRAEDIRRRWMPQWSAGWPALLNNAEFTRGFVDHVLTTGNQFRAEFAVAQQFEPITAVTLKDAPDGIVAAAGSADLAGVRELTLFVQFASFTGRDPVAGAFAALAASPHLGALATLTVLNPMDDVACRNLAAAQSAAQLRRLTFRSLTGRGLAALTESPLFSQVEELVLDPELPLPTRFGDLPRRGAAPGLRAVADSPFAGRLRVLRARNQHVGLAEVAALAQSKNLPVLDTLDLRNSVIGDDGVRWLAASPLLGQLTDLNLTGTRTSSLGVEALLANPAVANLRFLNLTFNLIRNEGAVALAGCRHLANLLFLALNDCGLSVLGGRALAESPYLGNLEELQLDGNTNLGRKTVAQLRARFGDRVWFGSGG